MVVFWIANPLPTMVIAVRPSERYRDWLEILDRATPVFIGALNYASIWLEGDVMIMDECIREKLHAFLKEELGPGDLTTGSIPRLETSMMRAQFNSRKDGILAGMEFALEVFRILDPEFRTTGICLADGSPLKPGAAIASFQGKAAALLKGERTALNILQRLSGIASMTRQYVQAMQGSRTKLLDTRKTTPGFRLFEKHAVRAGGGSNHRMGLFDGAMIKDNHIAATGSIREAVQQIRSRIPITVRIEVETENISQVKEALDAGADIIMLDNMSLAEMADAVRFIDRRAKVEASGGVSLEDIPMLSSIGLDYISTSSIITQAGWLDIGMDIVSQ